MKLLKDILYSVGLQEVAGSTELQVSNVQLDSRKVTEGSLFIAVRGTITDGHKYIQKAIELGAVAIVAEEFPGELTKGITFIKVEDSSKSLGTIATNFYDNPSRELKLVAVTGTNGKTSTVTLLYNLFMHLGYKVGLLSTVQNMVGTRVVPATHTTPDAISLNELLAEMVDEGCEYCFMEASSHAIHQNRIEGLEFTGAVFTNISHDHLDYHKTFDEYIKAKKQLFDGLPKSAFALTNVDDKRGSVMLQNTKARKKTYSIKREAGFKAKILENTFSGLVLDVDGQELHSRLIGEFNAYNLLVSYAVAKLLDVDTLEALSGISALNTAEGRFDYFISASDGIVAIVDYAHTPDALKKVLSTINAIRTGNEKVITIVGCGGNRDKEKRPVMARVACELSNQVVLTSDNPRDEEPDAILQDMMGGVTPNFSNRVLTITDRKEAVKTACMLAQQRDIVLLAGKGHEKYQEIKGERFPFDDKELLVETLKNLGK